jgi:hypothetical protein
MAARGLSVKSGVALATEFQQLNTRLGDKAAKMEQTEWAIWRLFFLWNDTTPDSDFNIEYEKSFDLDGDVLDDILAEIDRAENVQNGDTE